MNTPEELINAVERAKITGINPRIHNPHGTLCPFTDRCRGCGLSLVCATYDDILENTIKYGTDAQVQFLFGIKKPKTCKVIQIGVNSDKPKLAISA